MLARALVCEPDLLLLDEPTNHLDIEAITWLEEFLVDFTGALLFVSHDRAFLKRLATRIVELDRGALTSWPGSYDDYVRRKHDQLAVEAQHNALFDKKLSREEAWIRQGVKARRTRNEGRVRALEALREQRRQRRDRVGMVDLRLEEGGLSGQLVFEAEHVDFSYGDTDVIKDFSVRVMRGDRIGIVGPNGAGKSTLIKLLLGELSPTRGQLRRGIRLQVAYFDQQRADLDPDAMVMDSVGEGSQTVTINGRSQHVAGYLQGFLFPPERLRSPVSTLSGGERNRLLLARLFARPANLLVTDEPTNDLDVETLELLEELLLEYQGTLLLVSHDRAFLDNAVTSTLVFEGGGRVGEYVGGYTDWLRQKKPAPKSESVARAGKPATATETPRAKSRKLSYKDQRELEALPGKIEALEAEQSRLQASVSHPGFYQQPGEAIAATLARLQTVTAELEECYARWETLESQIPAA
jgi:ATP-binding cassette subfamily F protein uup